MTKMARRGAAAAVILGAVGCGGADLAVDLRVVDEEGAPIPGAVAVAPEGEAAGDDAGVISLRGLGGPTLLRVEAPGHLAEPVIVGWEDAGTQETVRLWRDLGGRRFAYHAGGDVMLGRRYLEDAPFARAREGSAPLIVPGDAGESARRLVAALAPALSAADLTTVNLETVVGDLPAAAAYPGKRYLLQSPPSALSALTALGVDVVVLGNNHQRDWLDAGLEASLSALGDAGLVPVGAGLTDAQARAPARWPAGRGEVAILSYTTVDGAWVDDQYPDDDAVPPSPIPDGDAWLWETRRFGFTPAGAGDPIPLDDRRIGGAWRALVAAEAGYDAVDVADLWSAATAVYPELQDWVAQRGHGGAARWDERSPGEIAAAAGADVVVVQLHAGFELEDTPGDALREAARAAVDAGADLVVAHHPHVVSGVEVDRGALVAYSLGNLVFDQDLLPTFDSAFLRTVWEDGQLVDAALVPLVLDAYVPGPASGGSADRILHRMWAATLTGATARRDGDDAVRAVLEDPDPQVVVPGMRLEGGIAHLELDGARPRALALPSGEGGWQPVPRDVLLAAPQDLPAGAGLGRDLLGWGRFEAESGAAPDEGATCFAGDATWARPDAAAAAEGARGLLLARAATADGPLLARACARSPAPEHRLWRQDGDALAPADGDATYALRMATRRTGEGGLMAVRLAAYLSGDDDPTHPPVSQWLRELRIPVPVERRWSVVILEVDPALFDADPATSRRPDEVLLTLELGVPRWLDTRWMIDDLALVEMRPAADAAPRPAAVDYVVGAGVREVEVLGISR